MGCEKNMPRRTRGREHAVDQQAVIVVVVVVPAASVNQMSLGPSTSHVTCCAVAALEASAHRSRFGWTRCCITVRRVAGILVEALQCRR